MTYTQAAVTARYAFQGPMDREPGFSPKGGLWWNLHLMKSLVPVPPVETSVFDGLESRR
jgi:hypothetical protein